MKESAYSKSIRELLGKDIDEVVRFAYNESTDRNVDLAVAISLSEKDSSIPKMKILGFVQSLLAAMKDSEISKPSAKKCGEFLFRLSQGASQEESRAINRIFHLLLNRDLSRGS